MGVEIERKFLANGDRWRLLADAVPYRQGYLVSGVGKTVRVRTAGDRGYITIKGAVSGISRAEYEYEIPLSDAKELLDNLCDRPLIEKNRHRIEQNGLVWEVDEFFGENEGLVIVEVELPNADHPLTLPDWVGAEVSDDPRYYNSNLAKHPYRTWA